MDTFEHFGIEDAPKLAVHWIGFDTLFRLKSNFLWLTRTEGPRNNIGT